MLVYVLFVVLQTGSTRGGLTSFQYEFKDKIQCEKALDTMLNRKFDNFQSIGYCQEVRK